MPFRLWMRAINSRVPGSFGKASLAMVFELTLAGGASEEVPLVALFDVSLLSGTPDEMPFTALFEKPFVSGTVGKASLVALFEMSVGTASLSMSGETFDESLTPRVPLTSLVTQLSS